MNTESRSNFEVALGMIMSFLFGFVLNHYLTNFQSLVGGLNNMNSEFASTIAIVAFGLNLFRMFHGYIINFFDTYNPSTIGGFPDNFFDLLIVLSIFIIPFYSMNVFGSLQQHSEYYDFAFVILALMLPQAVYIIWDLLLYFDLRKVLKRESNNVINSEMQIIDYQTGAKHDSAQITHYLDNELEFSYVKKLNIPTKFTVENIDTYLNFVIVWLIGDFFVLIATISTFIFSIWCLDDFCDCYNEVLYVLSTITVLIVVLDYTFNKDYYFKIRN